MSTKCAEPLCPKKASQKCWECAKGFCSEHISNSKKREGWQVCQMCNEEHLAEPFVWRANIKTQSEKTDPYEFALSRNLYGVGWAVKTDKTILNWTDYVSAAEPEYGTSRYWKSSMKFLRGLLAPNDLIWIRDNDAQFWLGRVCDAWHYAKEGERADVVNVVGCEWMKVDDRDVPGSVMTCRGLYRLIKADIREYCKAIWNSSGRSAHKYALRNDAPGATLFALLTSSACEDLVAFFLQQRGYSIVPSWCKASTRKYEFLMIHRETGEEALVQVKSGRECLDINEYKRDGKRVFLFTALGTYIGEPSSLVEALNPEELMSFALEHRSALPGPVSRCIDIVVGVVPS